MPYVNLKLVKGQATSEQRRQLCEGLTDLIVGIMGRNRDFTVITVDELESGQWWVGGKALEERGDGRKVASVNIKISKGTSSPEEMARMIASGKELLVKVLGNTETANYFIFDELNPDAWGFDGIPMTVRNRPK
jgi:4-oxalocrotonate tautomerase